MGRWISLNVQGFPTPYSGEEKEQKWRQAIEREAKLKRDEDAERSISASTMFTVTIQFKLKNALNCDLDNLIKSVIDTLFYAPSQRKMPPKFLMPTGALFIKEVDDKHIFKIQATKEQGVTEGAIITVFWE